MPEVNSSSYFTMAGWNDVPHLDEKTKAELRQNTPRHLRDAREKGEPSLGSGAIYPIAVDDIRVPPFPVPAYFYRGYGFDPGWKRTACVWGAHDRDNDVLYLIGEHYVGEQPAAVHAAAIKARGEWQRGQADYAGVNITDGERVINEYRKLGLKLTNADKAVEAGIQTVYDRLTSGRLKVFSTLTHWFNEYRFYIRDEKTGKPVKKNDHLMDATRYLVMGILQMTLKPQIGQNPHAPRHRPLDRRAGY